MAKVFRLDQLDDEVRAALGLAQRLGLQWDGIAPYPTTVLAPGAPALTRADGSIDATGWTDAQRATFTQTCDAHVPNANWSELNDVRACRLYLGLAPGAATPAQTQAALSALIRIVRGLAT